SPIHHALGRPDANGHLCKLMFDRTETRYGFSKRDPLFGILNRIVESCLRTSHGSRAQFGAADIEDIEGDVVAFAYFADDVVDRNLCIIQNERTSRGAAKTHLILFGASGNAGIIFLDNEATELLAVGLGKGDEEIGECGVRYPHFLAIQNPVSAVRT